MKNKIAVFLLLLIIIGITIGCLFSPSFDLAYVLTNSGTYVTEEEILNSFNVEMGTNVFQIDYKKVEEDIEAIPYVQTANAKLELPNTISINFSERTPFALIKYLESYLVMDKFGYILEIIKENTLEDLPIIYSIEFDSYEIGKQLTDTAKTKYDNVVYLLENSKNDEFGYTIAEINYESISNVKIYVKESDVEIIYGEIDRNQISEKLKYISSILDKIKHKTGKLDLSSENYLEKTIFTERI